MSIFEAFLVFLVGWWLVLFMVLPFGVRPPAQPGAGHAASAPAHPHLRRKLLITTAIMVFLAACAYFVSNARAESGIYHAGSNDCASADYTPSNDVAAADTASLDGGVDPRQFEQVPTYLDAPVGDYTNNAAVDRLGYGSVNMGVISTDTRTGETRLNGQKIGGGAATKPEHCR